MSGGPAEEVRALLRLHRTAEALERATRALADDPDQPDVVVLRAIAHIRLREPEQALAVATRGCATYPDVAWMHQIRGGALSALGRHRNAVDAIYEATVLDPLNQAHLVALTEALIGLSSVLPKHLPDHRELIERAAQAAAQARTLAPHDAGAHFARAEVYLTQEDWKAATESARQGLAIDPEDPRGHEIAGIAAAGLDNARRAGDHFLAAVRADPHSSRGVDLLHAVRQRTQYWIAVAVLLCVPLLARLDGTWSNTLWFVIAAGIGIAGWILWDTRGRLSADAKTALRRAKRLR